MKIPMTWLSESTKDTAHLSETSCGFCKNWDTHVSASVETKEWCHENIKWNCSEEGGSRKKWLRKTQGCQEFQPSCAHTNDDSVTSSPCPPRLSPLEWGSTVRDLNKCLNASTVHNSSPFSRFAKGDPPEAFKQECHKQICISGRKRFWRPSKKQLPNIITNVRV